MFKFEGPFGSADFNDRETGLITPSSFVPHWLLSYTDNMPFVDRWYNSAVGLYDWLIRKFVFLKNEEEFTRKYFGHLEDLPSMDELLEKVAVILVNTHRALSPPRPSMPGKNRLPELFFFKKIRNFLLLSSEIEKKNIFL